MTIALDAVGMDAVATSGAASSTSSVSADLVCSYAVRARVQADLAQGFAVRAPVTADLNASFAVRTPVTSDLVGAYAVMAANGAPVLSPVFSDLACAYVVRAPVVCDLTGTFAVRTPVLSDLSASYGIRARVWRDLEGSYEVMAVEDFTRAPTGAGYRDEYPVLPDTVVRVGAKVSAISLATALRAARVDEGDGLDDEVMLAAAGYTADAEHETQRCFIRQTWRASWRRFPPAMRLPHAAPLADMVSVKFYDQGNVLRTLAPQDYLIVGDAEPAFVAPAPGRGWPSTAERPGAVVVEYAAGYGLDEAAVPPEARLYVQAKVQQQFSPVVNAKPQNFDRLLDGLRVYLC